MTELLKLLKQGRDAAQKKHDEEEKDKLGIYRAGTSGCYTPDGKCYGECPRVALARAKGLNKQIEDSTHIMFDAGRMHETSVAELLELAGCSVLKEEEIPIIWNISNTLQVTGRPDLIIIDDNKVPVCGLELKHMSSIWTVRDKVAGLKPSNTHLIQSAIYKWRLAEQYGIEDLEYKLLYTSSVVWHTLFNKMIIDAFSGRSDVCDIGTNKDGRTTVKKINPTRVVFDLLWIKDQLYYKVEGGEDKLTKTVVTKKGIEKYYKETAKQLSSNVLADKPEAAHVSLTKDSYDVCDYCGFNEVCKNSDNTIATDKWLDALTFFINKKEI